jgi:hypothetical protein
MTKEQDETLDTLLELDGEIYVINNELWASIEARRVEPNEHIPHDVRYCLNLHDKYNNRLLGYDNAHELKLPRRRKYSGRVITWDHKHKQDKVLHYEYQSASQMLEDFWKDVKAIIKNIMR